MLETLKQKPFTNFLILQRTKHRCSWNFGFLPGIKGIIMNSALEITRHKKIWISDVYSEKLRSKTLNTLLHEVGCSALLVMTTKPILQNKI